MSRNQSAELLLYNLLLVNKFLQPTVNVKKCKDY